MLKSMETAVIARKCLFSSAHFYNQPKFSEEQNRQEFGLCYTPHGHGHNYVIEAFVEGPIDPHLRLVMDLAHLDEILHHSTRALDHHHLNFEVPEFKFLIPTTENIALYLRDKIVHGLQKYPGVKLNRLRLFETDDLWVEVYE